MSLFRSGISLADLQNKTKQLSEKVEKLGADRDVDDADEKQRKSIVKRTKELLKQTSQLLQKTKKVKKTAREISLQDAKIEDLEAKTETEVQTLNQINEQLSDWLQQSSHPDDAKSTTRSEESEPDPQRVEDVDDEHDDTEPKEPAAAAVEPDATTDTSGTAQPEAEEADEQQQSQSPQPDQAAEPNPAASVPVADDDDQGTTQQQADAESPAPAAVVKEEQRSQDAEPPEFECIHDVHAAGDEDLTVNKGDRVHILETRSDGWWRARTADGREGLLPVNALSQPSTDYVEAADAEAQQSEQAATETEQTEPETTAGQQDKQKGVWFAPVGVIESRLSQLHREDSHLSLRCHLSPRLSESNLGFHDLYWDPSGNNGQLLKRDVRVSKCFRLQRCEHMPSHPPQPDVQAGSHYVKMCLFDGHQVLSNVHTVIALVNPSKPATWNFVEKLSDSQSVVSHAELFVRSNYSKAGVVLLLECGLHYQKAGKSGALCYGWTTFPLPSAPADNKQHAQNNIQNKKYELQLRPGCPFTSAASPQPQTSKTAPKVWLRAFATPPALEQQIDCLPDQLIWSTQLAPFAYYYRHLEGRVLVCDRLDSRSASLVADPLLASFGRVADQPDLMDALRLGWADRLKDKKELKKQSVDEQAAAFRALYMDTAFVLHAACCLPDYDWAMPDALLARKTEIDALLASYKRAKSSTAWLTGDPTAAAADSRKTVYKPLNIFDLAVDLMNEHAID